MLDGRWLAAGDRWSKLQWSAVVAAGCAVVESQGSTLDASRMVVEEIVTESDRMEPNKKVTVATVTFLFGSIRSLSVTISSTTIRDASSVDP